MGLNEALGNIVWTKKVGPHTVLRKNVCISAYVSLHVCMRIYVSDEFQSVNLVTSGW